MFDPKKDRIYVQVNSVEEKKDGTHKAAVNIKSEEQLVHELKGKHYFETCMVKAVINDLYIDDKFRYALLRWLEDEHLLDNEKVCCLTLGMKMGEFSQMLHEKQHIADFSKVVVAFSDPKQIAVHKGA